jgi:hypothetical protein
MTGAAGSRRAWAGPALVALAAFALHAAAWNRYGLFRDELYFISCGNRLAWGYVDQPPLIAAVARVAHGAFGLWVPGLRLLPWVASSLTVWATGMVALELGAGAAGATLAAVGVLASPVLLGLGHYLTMNAFEPLLFVLLSWTLARLAGGGDPRLWIVAGGLVGLGLLDKYSMGLYAATLGAGLLLTASGRRALATRWAFAGALLAAVLVLPNLLWQADQGFPFLELVRNGQLRKNAPFSLGGFAAAQLLEMNPVNAVLWIPGLVALLAWPPLGRFRFIGLAFVLLVVAQVAAHAKPYYLAPAFPPLLAAGSAVVAARLRFWPFREWMGERAGWLVALPALALLAILGVAAPMALPLLPVDRFVEHQASLGVTSVPTERHRMGALPQIYADQHGWEEMARAVHEAWMMLPPAERDRAFVFAQNYGEASAVELLGERLGVPPVASGHNNWFLWGWPPGRDVALVISDEGETCSGFASRELMLRIAPDPLAMPYESGRWIWACRTPTRPAAEIWRATRRYV